MLQVRGRSRHERFDREWKREIRRFGHVQCAGEPFGCDADNGHHHFIDDDGLPDDSGVPIEPAAPVLVRDGRNRRCAGPVVAWSNHASEHCTDFKSLEIIAGDILSGSDFSVIAGDDTELLERIEGEQLCQCLIGFL